MAEQSLPELWKEAEDRFSRRTGKALKLNPAKTLEDLKKEFESQQKEDVGKKEEAKQRAKEFGLNALTCLKLLGGIASQGASLVFGPADLCFNAISMLIDIPAELHDFHELVDGMFEQVSLFLGQFKIYSRIESFSTVDPELMRLIHKLMISFVDVCALSINLRKMGTWKSFKGNFKKVILNDDSGVQAELDNFKKLVETHSSIQGTVTLEEVLRSRTDIARVLLVASDTKESITDIAKRLDYVAEGIDILTAAEGTRKSEQTAKENQKKIIEKLLGTGGAEIAQRFTKACNDCWVASMKNSGEWMFNLPEYQAWADRKPEANPLLLVTGEPNTGKTFLSSAIVHQLQSSRGKGTQTSTRTPLAAYHFFAKKTEKNPENPRPVGTALKCLALQIADRDPKYQKKLLTLCESQAWADGSRFKDLSCKELWDSLNFVEPKKRDVTYFIVLDGLDQLPSESLEELQDILSRLENSLPDSDRTQLRVLATGTATSFTREHFGDVPTVNVPDCNMEEIGHYIDLQLKEKDLLQGRDPETMKLKDSIREKLPNLVEGDFFKVLTAINKINDLVASDGSAAEVESILKEAGQSGEEIAQDVVNAANQALSAKEIEEVNEILIWGIHGELYFNVDCMQAALYLKFGTTPLQPLEKKLKGKYNKLFEYDESKDEYIRVSDEIENAVTTMANTRIKAEDIPHITATITITKATLSVAQRFLWNLAEQGVMKKFEFDELAAATTSKGTIRVNEFDAILWIITQSLKLLSAQPEERTKPLALYVVQFFPSHLDELRKHENFKSLELDEKREIGEGVYSYISDSDILEKFWTANGPPDSNWIDQADDITTMWQWLDDEEATRALGKRDKLWLKSIKQDPNPNRSLLRPIVKMIAKHWLLDRAWEVNLPFEWVRAFLQMVSHSADWIEEKRTDLVQDLQKKPQAEEIQEHEAEKEAEKVEVAESVKESEPVEPVSSLPEVKAVEAVEAVEETEEAKEVAKPGNETELAVEEPKTDTVTAEDDNISFIGFFETDTVAAAAKWVQRLYKVSTLDSLWYERLGETYISLYQFDLAIEALTQATKLENPHWNCFRRLAEALSSLGQQQDYPRVIECMDTVLDRLRKIREIQENKEEVTKNLIEALKQRARWQNGEDKVTTQACYQEVLALDPDDMDANYEILKNYLQTGQEESFGTHLNALSNRSPQESELSTLGRLLMHSVGYENGTDISIFDMIFRATQKSPLFDLLLDNMEDAITVARKENTVHELAALLLQIGIALYHFDQRGQKNPDSALVFWSECGSLNSGNSSWTIRPVCQKAFRLTSFHYFHKAKASTDPSSHLEKMKQVLSRQNIIDLYSKAYLGSYYALYGEDPGEAKKLYLDDFMTGLSLLSDEYEWNDYQGYLYLADILMHSGDYLNSLSAWSLIIPGDIDLAAIFLNDWKIEPQSTIAQGLKHMIPNNEVQSGSTQHRTYELLIEELDRQIAELEAINKPQTENTELGVMKDFRSLLEIRQNDPVPEGERPGSLQLYCDGQCGKGWRYSDNFYCCKACPDVQFCKECRDKLVAGKLPVFICSPEHDWLHVPKWDDEEYATYGRGKVKIGGTWDGEKRVGGEVVTIEAWLDMLRDQWGVPREAESGLPTANGTAEPQRKEIS